jgi:hypothetical protein
MHSIVLDACSNGSLFDAENEDIAFLLNATEFLQIVISHKILVYTVTEVRTPQRMEIYRFCIVQYWLVTWLEMQKHILLRDITLCKFLFNSTTFTDNRIGFKWSSPANTQSRARIS